MLTPIIKLGLTAGQKTAAKIGTKIVVKIGAGIAGTAVYSYAAPKLIKPIDLNKASANEKINFSLKKGTLFAGSNLAAGAIADAASAAANVAIEGSKIFLNLI